MKTLLNALVLAAMLISPSVRASSFLALDLFVSKFSLITDETSMRSRMTFLWGSDSFQLGPLLRYDPQHSYLRDFSMGLNTSVHLGKDFYLETDFSFLRRKFSGFYQNGFVIGTLLAWQATRVFRISLPLTLKRVNQGEKRWTLDYIPHLGVRFSF